MADKNNILYLFDRPTEPIFIGKGDENVSFDVPTEYLVSKTRIIFISYYYYLSQMCKPSIRISSSNKNKYSS